MVIAANSRRVLSMRMLLAFAFAALLSLLPPRSASAQNELQAPEPRVKAAFLFKFGSYVDWPAGTFASAGTPLTIGVLDADALADELTAIVTGRTVEGRPVVVRKLHIGDPTTGLHVVFVGKGADGRLMELLAPLKGRATLVVTESDDAIASGSMINFVIVDGKVRFDVALPPAEAGNLKISSRLLAVARKVVGPS